MQVNLPTYFLKEGNTIVTLYTPLSWYSFGKLSKKQVQYSVSHSAIIFFLYRNFENQTRDASKFAYIFSEGRKHNYRPRLCFKLRSFSLALLWSKWSTN